MTEPPAQQPADRLAIPDPPREAKWSSCRRYRWAVGLISGLLLLISGLTLIALLFVGGSPFADNALDSDAASSTGEVLRVDKSSIRSGEQRYVRVHFRFRAGSNTVTASCMTRHPDRYPIGSGCLVEYLAAEPTVARIRGERRSLVGGIELTFVLLFFLPALLGVLFWLRGVFALRNLLRDGTETAARVLSADPVKGVKPPQLGLHYAFEDEQERTHEGRQQVRTESALGNELADSRREVIVIYDTAHPSWSRAVVAEDFEDSVGSLPR